jgi:hypothetical protein
VCEHIDETPDGGILGKGGHRYGREEEEQDLPAMAVLETREQHGSVLSIKNETHARKYEVSGLYIEIGDLKVVIG